MKKRLIIKIHGLVQGVFFRACANQKAVELKLLGSVENLPDGTVVIVAEGEEASLKELLIWSKNGPELAQVENVESEWQNATGEFTEFQVLY